MCAVGLIKKNKQKIQFLQKNNKENKDNINKELNIDEKENINIDREVKEKLNELEEKRKQLAKSYIKYKFYEKYSLINNKISQRKAVQRI